MKSYFLNIACLVLTLVIGAACLSCGGEEDCVPECTGRECGPDGCGGTCMPGCGVGETCNASGQCAIAVVGEFLTIQPGTFQMGSLESEAGRWSNEDQHTVTLSGGFEILSAEVTQGQFESLMGYNPSSFTDCGTDCPVETVNWYEAAAYCNAFSASEGLESCYTCTGTGVDVSCEPAAAYATPYDCPGYRLPTEAEWEYAARAGTTTATYNGDLDEAHLDCEQPNDVLDPIAWFCGNSVDTTHATGTRTPNSWGLYDMLGNVWEWCHDWQDDYPTGAVTDPWGATATAGTGRVVRGGSWVDLARDARAAGRFGGVPDVRLDFFGFRPVRSIEP